MLVSKSKIMKTDREILNEIDNTNGHGVLRLFLSSEEIKVYNALVKSGYLQKGKADEKGGTVAYFITDEGRDLLYKPKNTRISFYLTTLTYNRFEKVVYSGVINGTELTDIHEAKDWLAGYVDAHWFEIDVDLIFEQVVLYIKQTDSPEQEFTVIHRIPGELTFDLPQPVIKKRKPRSVKTKDKVEEKPKTKKDYPSCWIEPNGTEHIVDFANHNSWAWHYLLKEDPDYKPKSHRYAYTDLEDRGWIRVLGWTDPPTFSLPRKVTPKQRKAVMDYCQSNACNLPSELNKN